jgi:chemotaxis protein methyltransferase CheR
MSFEEFATLRDFVAGRTGIHVRDTRVDYLDARVVERIKARRLAGVRDYYYFLKYSPDGDAELQSLVDLLTVQETSFFRSPEQLEELGAALPAMLAKRETEQRARAEARPRPFRVWSAACATGEEPATLAILTAERVPGPVEILATDISSRALAATGAARFPAHRMRAVPEAIRRRFFEPDGSGFRLAPALASRIHVRHLNLSEPESFAGIPEQDVILCRNAFIYLSEAAKLAAAQAFYRLLAPWGLLLLGGAETIDISRVPFQIRSVRGGLMYQKA